MICIIKNSAFVQCAGKFADLEPCVPLVVFCSSLSVVDSLSAERYQNIEKLVILRSHSFSKDCTGE